MSRIFGVRYTTNGAVVSLGDEFGLKPPVVGLREPVDNTRQIRPYFEVKWAQLKSTQP